MTYDALLLVGFGGPESAAQVMPFLERVTAGRGVPRERLARVAEHYHALGGASPLNAQNRDLLHAVVTRLRARGMDVPAYLGHRNSPPYVGDVLTDIARAGHRRVLAFAASAFPSYSGCRQYREDLAVAPASLQVTKLAPYTDLPGLGEALGERLAPALAELGSGSLVLATAHSIPSAAASRSGRDVESTSESNGRPAGGSYVAELRRVSGAAVATAARLARVAVPPWRLVFQSRSGPPQVPWLEPDVGEAIRAAAADGVRSIALLPVGFLTDHVEVLWDLDVEAASVARELGVRLVRVQTPGTHPAFLDDLADRLADRLRGIPEPAPARWCGQDCCADPARPLPVVAGG